MAVVVVGGNSRNIGKTSVVASLIAALPEMHWIAFKVTQHGHLLCDGSGRGCKCMPPGHTVELTEETNRTSGKDSARFLYAGAVRSFLLRTRQGSLVDAMPLLNAICETAENSIIESNGMMEFLRPELYLVVLDPTPQTSRRRPAYTWTKPTQSSGAPRFQRGGRQRGRTRSPLCWPANRNLSSRPPRASRKDWWSLCAIA